MSLGVLEMLSAGQSLDALGPKDEAMKQIG
jgi:hypothetical protein